MQFGLDGEVPLSSTSVSRVRSAVAQVLIGMNRHDVAAASRVADLMFITHLHDEAQMRTKSCVQSQVGVPMRTKYSMVQNNVITLSFAEHQSLPFLFRLQALETKTAHNLCTALLEVVLECLNTAKLAATAMVVHILVGDAVASNLAAARVLWHHLQGQRLSVRYRLVVVKCVSHQANLCTSAAVRGLRDPA